jgi:hypothetical protein
MGTLTAAGAIKCGVKRITATEAVDSLYALKLGGFTSYAKPGKYCTATFTSILTCTIIVQHTAYNCKILSSCELIYAVKNIIFMTLLPFRYM